MISTTTVRRASALIRRREAAQKARDELAALAPTADVMLGTGYGNGALAFFTVEDAREMLALAVGDANSQLSRLGVYGE